MGVSWLFGLRRRQKRLFQKLEYSDLHFQELGEYDMDVPRALPMTGREPGLQLSHAISKIVDRRRRGFHLQFPIGPVYWSDPRGCVNARAGLTITVPVQEEASHG
jgi:hypothetical protein